MKPRKKETTMNRKQVNALRKKLNATMKGFAEAEGLAYVEGNASFDDTTVTFKVGLAEIDADGVVATKEAKAYDSYKTWNKLSHTNVGDTFKQNGKTFRIDGWRTRAPKRPVLTTCLEDGRQYVFPPAVVAMATTKKGS
jgi:hypothetical protein